ncbi:MAG: ParB/RepB/Spo0J family partition protein [Bacteroidales bacterium]|nr:ParB/RepB/Spo0J family partition protein [Bacteroidales bacterium]
MLYKKNDREVDNIMKNENKITPVNIPVEKLHPFEGHPYKVLDNDEMNMLITSIQKQGIMTPLIVRPIENTDEYEVISGHRRLHAAEKAGINEVPALIYALDRNAATIAVVDSNLHREHILPSEKAFAYKLKMESLKHQGLALSQVATKSDTAAEIGKQLNESRDQVFRYIRLTNLIPEILQYVDDGKIALTPAVELSYLTEPEQQDLFQTMESEDCTPSLSQAQKMKKLSQDGLLDIDKTFAMLTQPKANQAEKLKIPVERVRSFFPKDYTTAQIEDSIVKMCEERYLQKKQQNRNERGR